MHAEDVGVVGALAQLTGDAIGVQGLGVAKPRVVVVGVQNLVAALGVDVAPLLGNDYVDTVQSIKVRGDGEGPVRRVLGVAGLNLLDHFLAHLVTEVVGADGEEVHVEHRAQTAIPHGAPAQLPTKAIFLPRLVRRPPHCSSIVRASASIWVR